MRNVATILWVFLLFLSFEWAGAHSSGASLERVVGEYVIDVGYDPAEVRGGDRLILDFNITKDGTPALYDYVWVRLMAKEKTLLAAGVARSVVGPTTLLYLIPSDATKLTISARYYAGGEMLAEVEFPLVVAPEKKRSTHYLPLALAALFGGVLLFSAAMRMRRT